MGTGKPYRKGYVLIAYSLPFPRRRFSMAMPTLPGLSVTAKQDAFCKCIFAGLTQRAAYLQAYDAGNMAIETVDTEAWVLMENPEIAKRIAQLRQDSETHDPLIMSVSDRKRRLSEIAKRDSIITQESGIAICSNRDSIHAIDIHNKMDRLYADTPVNPGNTTFQILVIDKDAKQLVDRLLLGGTETETPQITDSVNSL